MTVAVNIDVMRRRLRQFDFAGLLVDELGWDHHRATVPPVEVDGTEYSLRAVAQKCGLVVFECAPGIGGGIPPAPIRRRIEKQVGKWAIEHLIVFIDADRTTQVWQWVKRRSDGPDLVRHETFYPSTSGDLLLEKLRQMVFDLGEEDRLTIIDAAERVRRAFDVEKVTKKFYERFRAEHMRFLGFIKGISKQADREWYASLMLNRLMFVYFVQRKGFLDDGDYNYLRNRLEHVRKTAGKDQFQSFYRLFLLRLFHEGLSKPQGEHGQGLVGLLGKVPYLNGGLFDVHDLERDNPDIRIPDEAFVAVFDFFDEFDWHLDSRPSVSGNEINPDVLGYIFERYINQRQMGAYYTKEDITGYICRNTIVPFLLAEVAKACPSTFADSGLAWTILAEEPDAYLPTALRHGISFDQNTMKTFGEDRPLPPVIAAGTADPSMRTTWNSLAADGYALPTETWREHVGRRERYVDIRAKLRGKKARDVTDLVAWNVDLERFARDVILQSGDIGVVMEFWAVLQRMSVLDPTCGSGAFLFAALNILHDLYDACLEAMDGLREDAERVDVEPQGKLKEAVAVLAENARHRSRSYAILKSVMVNNLYGVDLMEEATEICKLRLFLKLVAQVERDDALEPLPDVDFNIRAGNTLIGFGSIADVRTAASLDGRGQARMLYPEEAEAIAKIEDSAKESDAAFQEFKQLQIGGSALTSSTLHAAKDRLKSALSTLKAELNGRLATSSGVDSSDFSGWLVSTRPFHWCVDFYGVMRNGGFDVVIGNPPYVEQRNVTEYRLNPAQFRSWKAANLYAYCMERSFALTAPSGRFGMIVPAGLMGLKDSVGLRHIIGTEFASAMFSTYAIRPSKLFDGVDQRLCIFIGKKGAGPCIPWTARYHHWNAEERPALFGAIEYVRGSVHRRLDRIPQVGNASSASIVAKLERKATRTIDTMMARRGGMATITYHRSPRYWIRAMDFAPYFQSETRSSSIHHNRDLLFPDTATAKACGAILNSTIFFFWFLCLGNGRNITGEDVKQFPVGEMPPELKNRLATAFDALMHDYKTNSFRKVTRRCTYQEFRPGKSKHFMDAIDIILAEHYGFTPDETDFTINFEIKYRLGVDEDVDDDSSDDADDD